MKADFVWVLVSPGPSELSVIRGFLGRVNKRFGIP